MTGLSGISRFGKPKQLVCSLATTGTLPNHSPGQAYTGSFGVTGATGNITAELVSSSPPLPAGWSLSVNQTTDQVTLAWPGTAAPGATPLSNLGFESGDAQWLKGSRWAIDTTGLKDGGTWSAKYDGPGQSTLQHIQAVPVTPGTSITASCRVSKGNTREDFAGGAVVLQWLDAAYNVISFNVGNVVNTGTAAFQTSAVTAIAPAGSAFVRLAASGSRDVRGRARDKVYADNFAWNHSYAIPEPPGVAYAVVIRLRDGRGCQATLAQTVAQFNPTSILSFDSGDGTTDRGGQPLTWTRVVENSGVLPVVSTAQSRFGGASAFFDARSTTSGSSWYQATGNISGIDFTQEAWVYRTATASWDNANPAFGFEPGTGTGLWLQAGANAAYFMINGDQRGAPLSIPLNTWTHLAYQRRGSVWEMFVNGILATTETNVFAPSSVQFCVGTRYRGHIDEHRITFGTAVYPTGGFTPPSAPF